MGADLLLGQWEEPERLDDQDREAWYQEEAEFFKNKAANKAKTKAKAKAKKRGGGGNQVVVKSRLAASRLTRSVDHALRNARGKGLDAFLADAPGSDAPLGQRPSLNLFFDEASPNIAMYLWLAYHKKLRVVGIRDIFHRQWNDVMNAIKAAGLWWAVLLTSVAFNLPYGPWQGSAWFGKLQEGAAHLLEHSPSGSKLTDALYAAMCNDRGEEPTGAAAHRKQVLRDNLRGKAFERKGPRVALKRWFSWLQAAAWHDECWHSRLLVILFLGMKSRVYKSAADTPYFGGAEGKFGGAAEQVESSDDETKDAKEAAKVPAAAKAASSKAPSHPEDEGAAEDRRVATGNVEVAALRKKCKNTLYVAAAALSTSGLQRQVRLITALANPLYDVHAENARDARAPPDVLFYYVSMAKGVWVEPLRKVCRLLTDAATLRDLGCETVLDRLNKPGKLPQALQEDLDEQDALAVNAWDLAVALLRTRGGSMMWHSGRWPGLLALFASENVSDRIRALQNLKDSWAAFADARDKAKVSTFLGKVTMKSPFATTVMSEAAAVATDDSLGEDEVLRRLDALAKSIFTGWGQTKVVEDGIRELRDVEQRGTTNKKVAAIRQLGILRDRKVIALHKREEFEPTTPAVTPKATTPWSTFTAKGTEPTIEIDSLTGAASWPTLSAQTYQVIAAEMALVARAHATDGWEDASGCWKCLFVPTGACLKKKDVEDEFWVNLGHVGYVALLVWPLVRQSSKGGRHVFSLAVDEETAEPTWAIVCNWDEYEVVPCSPVSPATLYRFFHSRFPKTLGVVLRQDGDALSILRHAAEQAFWRLPKTQLDKLARDRGVRVDDPSLLTLLEALVRDILDGADEAQIDAILAKRAVAPPARFPTDLPTEVI